MHTKKISPFPLVSKHLEVVSILFPAALAQAWTQTRTRFVLIQVGNPAYPSFKRMGTNRRKLHRLLAEICALDSEQRWDGEREF